METHSVAAVSIPVRRATKLLLRVATVFALLLGITRSAAAQWWSAPVDLGGVVLTSAPAAVANTAGRIDAFYRGPNNHLWTSWWEGQWWSAPTDLVGAELTSAPAAIIRPSGRIDVFYRGPNGHLWTSWWDGHWWSAPTDLGGVDLASAPTAVVRPSGRIDVFYRGPNNHLWTSWWEGQWWSAPTDLGGVQLESAPAATSRVPGRIDVFYEGPNHHLWTSWWEGQWWSAATDLGGVDLVSGPAAVSRTAGRIDVFYQGPNHHLWTSWWEGQWWSAPTDLGGVDLHSEPGAVVVGGQRLRVFYQGPNDHLWMSTWPEKEPPPVLAADVDHDGIADSTEAALLARFSPYYKFSYDHDAEEHFNPTDPIAYIKGSALLTSDDEDSRELLSNAQLQDPAAILSANIPDDPASSDRFGSSDLTLSNLIPTATNLKHKRTNYRLNPLGDGPRHGAPWPEVMAARNIGLFGHVSPYNPPQPCPRTAPDGSRLPPIGRWERPNSDFPCLRCYKIEYYQFFGYNNAAAVGDIGDHEGDWAILTLIYESAPGHEGVLAVTHWAHGYEMQFDLTAPGVSSMLNGSLQEFHGPGFDLGDFQLAKFKTPIWDGVEADEPQRAQNNILFLQADAGGGYTHPVAYVEYGGHELWPSRFWAFAGAPKHGGDGHWAYQTQNVPNLGEVEYPMSETARIIMRYNGYWGTYNKYNDNPPGPSLHKSWNWPTTQLSGLLASFIPSNIAQFLTCDDKE